MAVFTSYKKLINGIASGDAADIPDHFVADEAPKLKFNWSIQLFPSGFSLTETGSDDMQNNKFAVKTIERPKPTIEYQDINQYNFRTKVAVRMDYGTVNLSFYDDSTNRAHNILTAYLKYVSPIANANSGNGLDGGQNSSIGPLNRKLGPFESIKLTHYYIKHNAVEKTTYKYLNPKIVNFDFGDLDMTQSDVSLITLSFNYDAVNIEEG